MYYKSIYHLFRHFSSIAIFTIDVLDLEISIFVLGGDGKQHKLALVQYVFDSTEREVKVKPHGNNKTTKPFYSTSEGTKHRLHELEDTYSLKDVFHKSLEESGGILNLKSAGGVCTRC